MRRLLATLLFASTLVGQTSIELRLPDRSGMPPQDQVFTQILHVPGSARQQGYGFSRIYFENKSAARRVIDVRLSLNYARYNNYSVEGHLELEGEESGRLFLPVPYHQSAIRYQIEVDGVVWDDRGNRFQGHVGNSQVSALCIASSSKASVAWKTDLTARLGRIPVTKSSRRRTRAANLGFQQIEAPDIPGRWPLLSGFDIIIVDASALGLKEHHQATLADYAAAGGRLIVLNHATLSEGPLYSALEAISGKRGAARGGGTLVGDLDFGSILAFGDTGESFRNQTSGPPDPAVRDWFVKPETGALRAGEGAYSGPAPVPSYGQLDIPGLGGVPVRLFFFLIFGFAILVGPVNWTIFVKRRKQPLMLLATIPITGLGFAAVLLSWGVISEGFGLQGNIRSLIRLDQRNHQSTAQCTRTIYAGLSPAKLAIDSGTYIGSYEFPYRHSESQAELRIDSKGHLGGSSLPSRVEITYATVTRARVRDRLRFKRSASGFALLANESFAPLPGARKVLLRDFDGKYWISEADGRMVRASASEAAALQSRYLAAFDSKPIERHRHLDTFERNTGLVAHQSTPWTAQITGPLAPGTYLAWVHRFEGEDDFGLNVDWIASSRLVRGTLAQEDIL